MNYSIAAVERDTGIGKDALRVWERRYGFPIPRRDANGERTYPPEQLEKLRLIKRLMDQGYRPGRIVSQPVATLAQLSQAVLESDHANAVPSVATTKDMQMYLALVQNQDHGELRRALNQALSAKGLPSFVSDLVAPLTVRVGQAWAQGDLAVHAEHLYTECISRILRQAVTDISRAAHAGSPSVLLTTVVQEPHGLGLLMAECLLTVHGCRCVSLGTQTPVHDIAHAAVAHGVDLVALSFSSYVKPATVGQCLVELRRLLPGQLGVWAGGQSPALRRLAPQGVAYLHDLASIADAVAKWRAQKLQS